MNKISMFVVVLLVCITVHAKTGSSSLTVTVTGIKKVKGSLMISLFNSKDEFNKKNGKALQRKKIKITGTTMSVSFNGLEPGEYGVMTYQDVNDNDKLDFAVFIPSEPVGVSNNPKLAGPPKFKQASFSIVEGKNTISVKLK